MKNFKLIKRMLVCVLCLSMIFGTCTTTFAAVEDAFTGDTVNYVSLGASNVNGYGLDGYLPEGTTAANKNTANVFGYRQCPSGSYVDLVGKELEDKGYSVNTSQLAISSMRVEELRVLLDEDYMGDAYTAWRFIGPGKWFENAAVTGGLDALRADYADSIADADLITVDIGVNNFGVYLSNQIASGGTAYDDDLSLVDPELAETYNNAKTYVYELIEEHADEYADDVSELEFAVDAMTYALAGFCINFDIVMEKIYELNPDATVVAVSIQNLMEGLEATVPGVDGPVPFGELFGALVDAANLYIAAGSPYSDDYLFADVSENGRVEFFLDQLLAYDGSPASLDRDMKDCFDVYDNDLMLSTKIGALAGQYNLTPEQTEDAKNIAYDVVAEIMQLGATNNVLDLGVILAGGYGRVEDGLLAAIEAEVIEAVTAVVADPSYEYSIDENFFNDIADMYAVPASLVNTVATLGIRTGIGNSFYGHPNRNGHAEIKEAIINALENDISGIDSIKDRLGIKAEDEAFVKEIIAEIKAIINVAQNGTKEEQKDMINNYLDILKAELNLTAEDEARINEFISTVTDLVEIVKSTSPEDVKAEIDAYIAQLQAEVALELAKNSHKYYATNEDSYYVAIGGDTLKGVGLTNPYEEKSYYTLITEELDVNSKAVVDTDTLLPSEVYDFIILNSAEIAGADLITYQTDASSFIYAALLENPDWSKYIDAETLAVINAVWEQIEAILTSDCESFAMEALSNATNEIKLEVMANLPEGTVTEEQIDTVVGLFLPCVHAAISFVENEKDSLVAEAMAIDTEIIDFAEKLAYTCVAYAVDTIKAIEAIQTINPDATLVVVGMYNPLRGLQIVAGDKTIDAGEIFDYVVAATNLYYAGYAVADGGFAYVDITGAETNGFVATDAINTAELEIGQLGNVLLSLNNKMHANATGHEYIKNQIISALTCDYSVYEQLDAINHTVKCSLCNVAKTEAHDFNGTTTCIKCGYTQVVTPDPEPTQRPNKGGGVSVTNKFTITFETNGGSTVAKAVVNKGELLVEPTSPTKSGFVFDGWYTDKALTKEYDFKTPVTKSFTLYAKWVAENKIAKFTDIIVGEWYYDYVKTIVEKGLMNGISETEFAPNATLTRGMFVTILHRVEGEPVAENSINFADVAEDQYYANAVKWASANGIVNGITETEFAPNDEVTREQMAAMISRYVDYKELEVPEKDDVTYTDSDMISEYAINAVNTAGKLGILIGNTDGSFAPQKNATRAEAATLFVRLLGVLGM